MKGKLSAAFFLAAAMLAFAASASAVDGTIEINQAKVLANGGFPYTISAANTSYLLTGNLTVPAGTEGINVTASNVAIDLNGFSIIGPGSSSGLPDGIGAPENGVTVENGTVTGFGAGVTVGFFGIVSNVHADANAFGITGGINTVVKGCTANNSTAMSGYGIYCKAQCSISGNTVNGNLEGIECNSNGCVISGNTANANKADAISCGSGCLISGNTAFNNAIGIDCIGSGCLATGNTIENNSKTSMSFSDATSGYGGNVLNGNGASPGGGTSMGAKNTNLCGGTAC